MRVLTSPDPDILSTLAPIVGPDDAKRAVDYITSATAGSLRALVFSEQLVRDAQDYQWLEGQLLRDPRTGLPTKELTVVSDESMQRLKMLKAFHEMKVRSAVTAIQMVEKATEFAKLLLDADPETAKRASADAEPVADSPLARMAEFAQSQKPLTGRVKQIYADRRSELERQAEACLVEEAKRDAAE